MRFRKDPGPCPVDDTPHTGCCAPGAAAGGIVAGRITPATTITIPLSSASGEPETPTAPLRSEQLQQLLPPAQFTTATYRGRKKTGG